MLRRPASLAVLLALVSVVGCQSAQTPASAPTDPAVVDSVPAPTQVEAVDPSAITATTATTGASATMDAAAAAALGEPAPGAEAAVATASPTVRPTAPKPTPRPLPPPVAPSQALEPTATTLQTKLNAFRAALRAQDVSTSLRLQRELLAAADDADSALKTDKSPEAQQVRAAVAGIRAGVGGDNNGLDHAATALQQALGGPGGTLGVTLTSDARQADAPADLHTLNEHLRSFREAVQGRKATDALRLQGQLLNDVTAFEKVAADDPTDKGQQLRDVLADLHKDIDSADTSKLAGAAAQLEKLDAAPVQAQAAVDMSQMAASLATKLDTFETARAAGSQADLLRLQQDILTEADQDAAQLGSDKSPQATAMRAALDGVHASVLGDFDKLAGARAKLGSAAGEAPSNSTGKPIDDLKKYAGDMDQTVGAFQDAMKKNDSGAMLRLRKQLGDQADQAEASLKGIQSKPAQQVLAAVGAIHTAFAGDLSKLDDARTSLRAVSGASPTPASGSQGTTPTTARFDAPGSVGGVRDRLTSLRDAARDPNQSAADMANRREALKAEVARADAALQGINDPRVDKLRQALTAAREAAAGDDAKANAALGAIQTALSGQ